jgi:predicted Zn-dependent protease
LFFKKLDEERNANLKKKNDLILRAIALKDSHEWDKAANELKKLQQEWKDIGPVPEKVRDKVFKEFKEACDFFFEQKRTEHGKQENEQVENLKAKEEICAQIEKHIAENTATSDVLKQLEDQFNQIGFVPKKDITTIRNRYHAAIEKFTNAIQGISEDEKSQLMLESQLNDLKNDPMAGQKLYQKEQAIRKKIQKVENDIALWRNNLEFFGRSKNADKYKDEFNGKINEATDSLKQLKQQLKLLRAVSS